MRIYQVGGSVRDELLGLKVTDRDFVVVGATPEEMVALGYLPVGKDFPVFLHPKTHEEYALARTERKHGYGYHGFQFFTSPTLTLEEDLYRRDLTVNAIARDADGTLIDPYGGVQDISKKIFRHVSPAFSEDPVRILRLARFLARFDDFVVALETKQLAKEMVENGETNHLVSERVWQEISRGLMEKRPDRMIDFLNRISLLPKLLFSEESVKNWHADDAEIIGQLLIYAVNCQMDLILRTIIVFFKPIVKDTDSAETLPLRIPILKLPKSIQELMTLFNVTWSSVVDLFDMNLESVWSLMRRLDPVRRPQRFRQWLDLVSLYDRYQPGLSNRTHTLQTLMALGEAMGGFQGRQYHSSTNADMAMYRKQYEMNRCAKCLEEAISKEYTKF